MPRPKGFSPSPESRAKSAETQRRAWEERRSWEDTSKAIFAAFDSDDDERAKEIYRNFMYSRQVAIMNQVDDDEPANG